MSIFNCINKAEKKGMLSSDEAKELREDYLKIDPAAARENSPVSDELAKAFLKQKADNARLKKYQTSKQILRDVSNLRIILDHPEDPIAGLHSLLVRNGKSVDDIKTGNTNIDNRFHAVKNDAFSKLKELVEEFKTKNLGLTQDVKAAEMFIDALYGKKTGNAQIDEFAKMWAEVAESLRQRFNLAGGGIKKRDKWRISQSHNSRKVRAVPLLEWKTYLKDRLDRDEIIDFRTGIKMSDERLDEILDQSYDTIRTDGIANLIPGKDTSIRVNNLHADHRVYIFKDSKSWLEYHKKFGEDDIFGMITSHIHSMSKDIALIEVLGPNPEAAFQKLRAVAVKNTIDKGTDKDLSVFARLKRLDGTWNVVNGKVDEVDSDILADFFENVRSVMVATKLPFAMLAAITDLGFSKSARLFNGLPVTQQMNTTLKLLNPANKEHRLFAVHMGLGVDASTSKGLSASSRFFGDSQVPNNFIGKAAEGVIRGQGLAFWTDMTTKAFSLDFYKNLADVSHFKINELPEKVLAGLNRYGITEKEWNAMRVAGIEEFKGNKYIRPSNLTKMEGLDEGEVIDAITKFQEMVHTESKSAVPMPDGNTKFFTTGGKKRGSPSGEAVRTLTIFKSFPITIVLNQLARMGIYSGKFKGQYMASVLVSTTVLGALSIQLNNISKGRDPEDMESGEFWTRAFMQGGGVGIFGDFLYSGIEGTNRYGGSFTDTLAGPAFSTVNDIVKITGGNFGKMVAGEDTSFAYDLVKFGGKNLPGTFYTKLATERLITDNLLLFTDKRKSKRSWQRMESRRKSEQNQKYWWRRGKTSPDRPPQFNQ